MTNVSVNGTGEEMDDLMEEIADNVRYNFSDIKDDADFQFVGSGKIYIARYRISRILLAASKIITELDEFDEISKKMGVNE